MIYVGNAFSLAMLPEAGGLLEVTPTDPATVAQALREGAVSVVGHASSAAVFAGLLGCPCAENRATVALAQGDTLYVGQYSGPRLPEGATTLPEGAAIRWLEVTLHPGTPRTRTVTRVEVGPGGTAVGTWRE